MNDLQWNPVFPVNILFCNSDIVHPVLLGFLQIFIDGHNSANYTDRRSHNDSVYQTALPMILITMFHSWPGWAPIAFFVLFSICGV